MKIVFAFSLSRLYDYFKNKPFAIVSAYLSGDEQNEIRAAALKKAVRDKGYGYREIEGLWKEKEGDHAGEFLVEYPLFIPEVTLEDALYFASGDYYDGKPQYSIIYSDGNTVMELRSNGAVLQKFEDFQANDLRETWEYYSKHRGKKWRYSHYEMVEVPPAHPKGWAEHRHAYSNNEKAPHDFYWRLDDAGLRRWVLDNHIRLEARTSGKTVAYTAFSDDTPVEQIVVNKRTLFVTARSVYRKSSVGRWNPSRFVTTYFLPDKVAEAWDINEKNLLLSRSAYNEDAKLERISWHPLTGEMLLSEKGMSKHAVDIHNAGSHPFDEYIRAIVLPDKRRVIVRPWYPFNRTEMFRLEPGEEELVSFEGQDAFRRMLVAAGMPSSWKFEYNGDNTRLEKLTGLRRW